MALINVAKTALRLTTNALDDELTDEIDACLLRLQAATLYANIRLSIPADISISSAALQKDALASFLNQPQNAALCQGFEFVAAPLTQGTLTSFAQLSALKPTVAFLTPHYFDLM